MKIPHFGRPWRGAMRQFDRALGIAVSAFVLDGDDAPLRALESVLVCYGQRMGALEPWISLARGVARRSDYE